MLSPISRDFFSLEQKLTPFRIVLFYAFIGIVWILFSDVVTAWFVKDVSMFELIALGKGTLFIITTSGLLLLLIRFYARQLNSSQATSHLAEQEIKKLAYYDRDTGLPNHNMLMDRLNQIIAFNSRKRKSTAVIYISLIGFKAIVDARGHSGGKEAVCRIAESLVVALRQYDTVARIHRDEFVIVLGGNVQEGDIAMILNKLQTIFSRPVQLETSEVMIPACFGVACFPADGVTGDLLLQHAHIAMNQARQNGETFKYFSEALNQKAVERHSIETGLLRALEDGEFFLCYQPKMDINGIAIIGMEALVRWQRPGQGIIPPDKFIPLAEENGLIIRLGTYVLKEACRQNKAWQDAGLPKLKVAVNLSARQLRDNAFVPLVMQIIAETGLDPHYLELELTESSLMGDSSDTVCKLLRLKEIGISISVDDFGTGYSSLSYLKHLPIDTLKVDRSFVRDIVTDPDDAAIVDAIVALARSLNLNVIAEGVETREQLEFLRQRNCQQVQGYFFSKPLVPHHFEYFLRTGDASVATCGPLSFNFTADFSSFEGSWSYKDQTDWNNTWNGTLISQEADNAVKCYSTNYGTLTFVFDGERVSGSYTHNDGRIEGTLQGCHLTGSWTQELKKHYVQPVPVKAEDDMILFDTPGIVMERPEPVQQALEANVTSTATNVECISDISFKPAPVQANDTIPVVLNRIQNESDLLVIPVVESGKVVGVINRSTFIEEHVIGRHGFGFHINHSRKISELMSPVELTLEGSTTIEEAAKHIQASRHGITRMDNIFVVSNGDYCGIVDVNKLFNAITAINLTLAKGANPLTGLPGNESIQREINERLKTGEAFDIAYIDIDNFKPFNDFYGFQRGDVVIKAIGEIISTVTQSAGAELSSCFCGHIGGDDFIVITEAHHAEYISTQIISALEEHLVVFHGEKDFTSGRYSAVNRKGEMETFGLISLSIGIVNTRLTPVSSYPQLASISTEVKKAAKKIAGSSVVINRRVVEDI